jgi:4-amino-4-deoxy-L-arabinose transferase-like glycosyltransferase
MSALIHDKQAVIDTVQSRGWLAAHRRTLVISLVLILSSLSVRLPVFDRYLPYLDYTDESVPFLIAQNWRGIYKNEFIPVRYAGYPPGFVVVNIGVQKVVEATVNRSWTVPPDYFFALRLLAVVVGTVTTLVVASIAGQLAGWLAALLAGLVWAFSPLIIEPNNLATPDPYVFLTCACAITLALYAWHKDSQRALTGSLIAGILAIYFKLWPIHAVLSFCVVALLLLRRNGRKVLPWLALQAVIAVVAAVYLFLIVRPLNMPAREVQTFNSEGLSLMFDPSRNLNNWYIAIAPMGLGLFLIVAAGAVAAYGYSRRRGWRTLDWKQAGLLLLYCLTGTLMASTFTNAWFGAGKIRHVLPMTVALLPLWAAGVEQIIWTVRKWAEGRQLAPWTKRLATNGLLAAVALVLVPTYAAGNIELVNTFHRAAMPDVLWHWTDVNLPTDGLILLLPSSFLERTWNREWGGYDGAKPFQWWYEDENQMAASTPEQYAQRGILYFALDSVDLAEHLKSKQAQAFLKQLTLVKEIPTAPNIYGNTVYLYRMMPPHRPADAAFADQIVLTGYDLGSAEVKPGDTLRFRPYWRALRQPANNYSMFVHLYPAGADQLITQHDGPLTVLERPTLTWDDTDELYIGADVQLAIPADTPPGDYRLVVGVYDYTTGIRLKTGEGDSFSIPVTVQPS